MRAAGTQNLIDTLRGSIARWGTLAAMSGCASVPSMSAVQHDQAARSETRIAQEERAHFDPSARNGRPDCRPMASDRSADATDVGVPCWREPANPTTHYLTEAQRHERMAIAHEKASAAQRALEERACGGVSELDRHTSPIAHAEEITRVTVDSDDSGHAIGVTVLYDVVPGLTVAWLQREVDCHLAIDAALGNDVPERDDCPLVPRGVRAQVQAHGLATEVVLRGDDDSANREVIRRVLMFAEDKIGRPATASRLSPDVSR